MILQPKQGKRFYRLLDSLMVYANSRLRVSNHLVTPYGELDDMERYAVAEALWDGNEHQQIIDDFISRNPGNLSRTDLKEVARWKCFISDEFSVMRDARDVFFLYAKHAIAVRGITREIDAGLMQMPTMVKTVLLPFENVVVYVASMTEYDISLGPSIRQSIFDELDEALAANRVVRNAAQFEKKASQLVEHEMKVQAEHFAYQTELDMNADAQVAGQHRSPLAGLSFDERKRVLDEHLLRDDNIDQATIVRVLREQCFRGEPARTIAEAYAKLNKSELQDMARSVGVSGAVSSMNKRQLLEAVQERAPVDAESLTLLMRMCTPYEMTRIRNLVLQDGVDLVPDSQVTSTSSIVPTIFPLVLSYHRNGLFVSVMTQEALEAFADLDWDREIASARRIDAMMDYVSLMVDLRGVVYADEALDECADRLGLDLDEDGPTLMASMLSHARKADVGFAVQPLGPDFLFVEMGLFDNLCDFSSGQQDKFLYQMLAERRKKEPRPVPDELLEAGSVSNWMMGRESVQALVAYLDEHVPDDADDYYFAEDVTREFVSISQEVMNPLAEIQEVFDLYGFVPTEAQLKRVADLLMGFVNDVPKWSNNGWAPNELRK